MLSSSSFSSSAYRNPVGRRRPQFRTVFHSFYPAPTSLCSPPVQRAGGFSYARCDSKCVPWISLAPTPLVSATNMTRALLLQLTDYTCYVGYCSSRTNILISNFIHNRNSEISSVHVSLSDMKLSSPDVVVST